LPFNSFFILIFTLILLSFNQSLRCIIFFNLALILLIFFLFVKVVFPFNLTLQSKKFGCPLIHFLFWLSLSFFYLSIKVYSVLFFFNLALILLIFFLFVKVVFPFNLTIQSKKIGCPLIHFLFWFSLSFFYPSIKVYSVLFFFNLALILLIFFLFVKVVFPFNLTIQSKKIGCPLIHFLFWFSLSFFYPSIKVYGVLFFSIWPSFSWFSFFFLKFFFPFNLTLQ
jgi:hypothetical protein